MRKVLLGLWSYFEFFAWLLVFLVPMSLAAIRWKNEPGRRHRGRWMRRFGRLTASWTPIWKFSVRGSGPADVLQKPYVVVSNHESTADPFLLSYMPWDMRWVGKAELFRTPFTGWLMSLAGDIPVQRGAGDSVRKMLADCKETLEAGVPVMLFPEGTRSPDGRLLPFKNGAFDLAISAGVPVLPVALAGTRTCRPKGSLWFGQARAIVKILEPVPTTGLGPDDVPKLRELVRTRIADAAAELQAELGLPVLAKEGLAETEVPSRPAQAAPLTQAATA